MHTTVKIFLLLSGIASLTYQVVWVRLLGLSLGSTSASIGTVIAAFFFGLAAGSYAARFIQNGNIRSLKPYLALEAIIGLSGVILLPLLLQLDLVAAQLPLLENSIPSKFLLTSLLLFIPTVCMGATFPIVTALLLRRNDNLTTRIGELYAFNTAGAVLGALLSAFVFIPWGGLDGATYIAVACNFSIIAIGFVLRKHFVVDTQLDPLNSHTTTLAAKSVANKWLAAVVLLTTGFTSIATEVGWSKYLSVFTGTTIFGFALILAIFLTGIFAGAWYVKRLMTRVKNHANVLLAALVLLAIALLMTRAGLNLVPPFYEGINHITLIDVHWLKACVVLFLLLPPTFLYGVIFPLAVAMYCNDIKHIQADVGAAYSINTIGGIFGAIGAGFWLIPSHGTDTLLLAMAITVLALPLLFIFVTRSVPRRIATVTVVGLIAVATPWMTPIGFDKLIGSVDYEFDEQARNGMEPTFLHLQEGKTGVISLVTYDDRYAKIQNNGLNESIIDMEDPHHALLIESLLAYVPYFFHADAKSAFVVGYGGGITTRAFTHLPLDSIHVVELEPAVVDAVKAMRDGPATALQDRRVLLEINDARNTLLFDPSRYDIIASQPSHPWLAGTAHVFTHEFFTLVKSRLNDDGIYSQWLNLFHMDKDTLKSIAKTFFDVFPYGMSFANLETGDFMLVGSLRGLQFDEQRITQRMTNVDVKKTLAHHKILSPQDLLLYFALSRDELLNATVDSEFNTDLNIRSEIRLSKIGNNIDKELSPYTWLQSQYHFDFTHYVSKQAQAETLYKAGQLFLRMELPDLTASVIRTLRQINRQSSDSLEHESMLWHADYGRATQWYYASESISDSSHMNQLDACLELADDTCVDKILARLKNKDLGRVARAKILFYRGQWRDLAAIQAQSNDELKWQLAAMARRDIIDAGKKLESIIGNDDDIPLLRVMAEYYRHSGQLKLAVQRERQIVNILDTRAERYKLLLSSALKHKNLSWAEALIRELENISPDTYEIERLKTRTLDALRPTQLAGQS